MKSSTILEIIRQYGIAYTTLAESNQDECSLAVANAMRDLHSEISEYRRIEKIRNIKPKGE